MDDVIMLVECLLLVLGTVAGYVIGTHFNPLIQRLNSRLNDQNLLYDGLAAEYKRFKQSESTTKNRDLKASQELQQIMQITEAINQLDETQLTAISEKLHVSPETLKQLAPVIVPTLAPAMLKLIPAMLKELPKMLK